MRILYLCLDNLKEGKASFAHVNEIIKGLRKHGYQVLLFSPNYNSTQYSPNLMTRFFAMLLIQLKVLYKLHNFDILYIRGHFASILTFLIAKLFNLHIVFEVNGPYEDIFIAWPWTRKINFIFTSIVRLQIRHSNTVICVTPQLAQWVRQETQRSKVFVVPNGANVDLFNPKARFRLILPYIYVIFFGSLTPWQGLETLIEAIKDPSWPSDVRLIIAGDGPMRPFVESASTDDQRLLYLGVIPHQTLPALIANSLAGLCPKNSLGNRSTTGLFPLKLFETLACGVPIIVSDFPGQADLVRKYECGLITIPEDPQSLAKAVQYLRNHPELRQEMGMKANNYAVNCASWEKRAEDTAKILLHQFGKNFSLKD